MPSTSEREVKVANASYEQRADGNKEGKGRKPGTPQPEIKEPAQATPPATAKEGQQEAAQAIEAEKGKERQAGALQAMEQREPARSQGTGLMPSPFGLLSAFLGDMDRMVRAFGFAAPSFFGSTLSQAVPPALRRGANFGVSWTPPLEVLTRDGELVIRVEVPGINKEQMNVEIDEERAIISGERVEEHEEKREGFYSSERKYGRFSRVVGLPQAANAEQAKATFADGVLEIVVPLAAPEPKARRIEIHGGGAGQAAIGEQRKMEGQSGAPQASRTM